MSSVRLESPLRFQPFLREMVWGGSRLATLGKTPPPGRPHGESWEISDHPLHTSVVAEGPWQGHTLRQLMREHRADLLGPRAADEHFPLLIKLLDAHDWLSVQVHPSNEQAARLAPGEGGKTEAWLVLAAEPAARVYAGLRPEVDEQALRQAVAAGTVDRCLEQVTPRPGDFFFFPAGTVHAVGGGVLLAEVQQTSDATFRLFDWNRTDATGAARPLHVEEAISCIRWGAGPVLPYRVPGYPPSPDAPPADTPIREQLVACPYFAIDYVRAAEAFLVGGSGGAEILLVTHGQGRLAGSDPPLPLRPGETVLLPAAAADRQCLPAGPIGLLQVRIPR